MILEGACPLTGKAGGTELVLSEVLINDREAVKVNGKPSARFKAL